MKKQKTLKDRLVPVILFAGVFAVEFILRRHTFLQKEYFSLFLNTPDYWNEIWNGPQPLLTLAGAFRQYMEAYNQVRMKEDDPIQPGTFWEYYFLAY